jgi:crotonobetainyl-CoA:carnitine CoA-transferase CaiB-like acyl-CoA transferase
MGTGKSRSCSGRPPLDQHTVTVLKELLGYDERKVSELREGKIVF